ncbi:hypothetical protein PG993_002899 [Apiospora rasikravindrae]|uniref:Uncharacterized protein n=1 Tax=Apiospora rasikravindrae TaxID=990691 RepID=A0ABR1U0P3_9PEZI
MTELDLQPHKLVSQEEARVQQAALLHSQDEGRHVAVVALVVYFLDPVPILVRMLGPGRAGRARLARVLPSSPVAQPGVSVGEMQYDPAVALADGGALQGGGTRPCAAPGRRMPCCAGSAPRPRPSCPRAPPGAAPRTGCSGPAGPTAGRDATSNGLGPPAAARGPPARA